MKQKQNLLGRGSGSACQRLKIPRKEQKNIPSPQGSPRKATEEYVWPEKEEGKLARGGEPGDPENLYLGDWKAGTIALSRQMLGEPRK